jgi:anti-sigma factor RsiW
MDCENVRLHLLDYQHGRLAPNRDAEILAHLAGCPRCREADAAERVLTDMLEQRLPQHSASLALKRRLAARWPAPSVARRRVWGWSPRWWLPAAAVALALVVATPLVYDRVGRRDAPASAMVAEAVNDHLRSLDGRRPVDITSGAIHQVKPWFAGRLDFAPVVAFDGDDGFPLRGAAVEYFLDRKAAVFVYGRRLHTVSVLVFRADGLPWPTRRLTPMGPVQMYAAVTRGFNVLLWRNGELGYAAVSDIDATELRMLALRVFGG